MSTALSIAAAVLLLFVAVWVAVFGGVGALLAPRRGRSAVNGFLWGALLGPIGWAVVLVRPGTVRSGVRRLGSVGAGDGDVTGPNLAPFEGGDDELPIH
jgi:hypothetical protein